MQISPVCAMVRSPSHILQDMHIEVNEHGARAAMYM